MVDTAGSASGVVSAALPVAKFLSAPIGRQINYVYNYKSNLEKLEREVCKLKDGRDEVKIRVTAAKKNVEKVKRIVEVWLTDVNSTIDEADKLIQQKNNSSSSVGLITRYKHGKKAFKLLEDKISQLLLEKRDLGDVSVPAIPMGRSLAPDKGYHRFRSRKRTLKEIVKALKGGNYMIGVCGMGGIGKTTLVKEIGRQVKEVYKLFDEVAFVQVTQTVDRKKIQMELGEQLCLRFNNKAEITSKLYARLTNKEKNEEENEEENEEKVEKILIILDDIWDDLDLKSIGIPDAADNGKCKLLLTTRGKHVLERMDSAVFEIGILTEGESWRLFKDMTGDFIETEEMRPLAKDICKKFGCLPIAIATAGKALKNKRDPSQWKAAFLQLKRSSSANFRGALEPAYSSIQLSYDFLSKEQQNTFLLCGLMRHQGFISDLVKYVLVLDIFQGIYKIEEARIKVQALIHELKDFYLLFHDHISNSFSMHEFVREVALSIASRDAHVFSVRNENEWEWPSQDRLNSCKYIFIRDSTISEPREGLECPELESFFMNTKVDDSRTELPKGFFAGMTKLKVLDLTRMKFSSLRSTLGRLKNLQTLCLDYSSFDDVTVIGELSELRILSLRGSNVRHLPREIDKLRQLRSLDLSNCQQLKSVAPKVISSLTKLEELYMRGCSIRWEDRRNASLDELKQLSHLTTLELDVKDERIFSSGFFSKKLRRYNISIEEKSSTCCTSCTSRKYLENVEIFNGYETLRTLKLKHNSIIWLRELPCFKNVEFLCLGKLRGIKNSLCELDREGFSQLKHLHLYDNPKISCIANSSSFIDHEAFPNLESLILFNLIELENICSGHPTTNTFSNLKIIDVEGCDKLEKVFSFADVRNLPQLQRVTMDDCENLKEVFVVEREGDDNNNNKVIDEVNFCQLRFLKLKSLPQLTSFCSQVTKHETLQERQMDELDTLTSLFNIKVGFPHLEALELREIDVEKIWDSQRSTLLSSSYKNLTRLTLSDCEKLKYVFPSSLVKNFEQLQHLQIHKCKVLKEIVGKGGGEREIAPKFVFPRLTFLSLKWLPELETFYPGRHSSEWPILKELVVCYCGKVKIFNSQNNERQLGSLEPQSLFSFQQINRYLEALTISRMDSNMIWQGQFPCDHFSPLKVLKVRHDKSEIIPLEIFQRFKYLECLELMKGSYEEIFSHQEVENHDWMRIDMNLKVLKVYGCEKLINLSTSSVSFQSLTVLKVKDCNGLVNLITSSTAKSLEQLREMDITACETMTKVVECEEDDVAEDEKIVFKNLKSLSLNNLERLRCFYSGNYILEFPFLEELEVKNCLMMKTFCRGKVEAPSVRRVQISNYDESCWGGELNKAIQKPYKERGRRQLILFFVLCLLAVIFVNLPFRMSYVLPGSIAIGSILALTFRRSRREYLIVVFYGILCNYYISQWHLQEFQQKLLAIGLVIYIIGIFRDILSNPRSWWKGLRTKEELKESIGCLLIFGSYVCPSYAMLNLFFVFLIYSLFVEFVSAGGRLRQFLVRIILAVIFISLYSRFPFELDATIGVGSILAAVFKGSKGPLFQAVGYGIQCYNYWIAPRAYLREIRRLPWLVKKMLPIVHFLNFDQTFRIIIQCNNPPSWFKRLPTKQELKECIGGGRLRQLIVRVILAVIFLNLYSRMAFYLHATIAVGSILAVIFRGSKGPLFLAVLYGMLCFHHWSARRAYLREIRRLPWLVKRLLPIVHFLNFDQTFHNIFHYNNLPSWFKRSRRRIIRQNL